MPSNTTRPLMRALLDIASWMPLMSSWPTVTRCMATRPSSLCPTRVYSPGASGTENSPVGGTIMFSPIEALEKPLPSDRTATIGRADGFCGSMTRPLTRATGPDAMKVTSIELTSSPVRSDSGVACATVRVCG